MLISILSLLYLKDVFEFYQVCKYFKSLCDEVLHNKIINVNNNSEEMITDIDHAILSISTLHHTLDMYQNLILYTIKKGSYNLIKNNVNSYHVSVWYNDGYVAGDLITADFDMNTIRDFLRHALYDGLINI